MYEMEVAPPGSVWEKLSIAIDEINADNRLAVKITTTEIQPPKQTWDNIAKSISPQEVIPTPEVVPINRKSRVVRLRTLAAAAAFIGIILVSWLFINKTEEPGELTTTGVGVENENPASIDTNNSNQPATQPKADDDKLLSVNPTLTIAAITNKNNLPKKSFRNRTGTISKYELELQDEIMNEKPGEKVFDQPIDDLSLVTAEENYMTMVNSNGRLVKIPAHFAHLAPHLQDKPVSEDIYEVMFGEGAYWKETLSEWRKKVISMPVASGDAFTSFIELLKSVQDK